MGRRGGMTFMRRRREMGTFIHSCPPPIFLPFSLMYRRGNDLWKMGKPAVCELSSVYALTLMITSRKPWVVECFCLLCFLLLCSGEGGKVWITNIFSFPPLFLLLKHSCFRKVWRGFFNNNYLSSQSGVHYVSHYMRFFLYKCYKNREMIFLKQQISKCI